jgi:hypothetical protein
MINNGATLHRRAANDVVGWFRQKSAFGDLAFSKGQVMLHRTLRLLVVAALVLVGSTGSGRVAYGQGIFGLGGGPAGSGAGGGGAAGGIMINAKGIVTPVFSKPKSVALSKKRMTAAALKFLPADMNKPSKIRMVSLVRLEEACEEYARTKKHVPVDIQFLAGLQRIDYIFVYPETNDLVIAGPAEGFAPDEVGRVVGVTTRRPPIRIDDLTVALRVLQRSNNLGCSIDPVQSRLAAMQRYIRANSFATSTAGAKARYKKMANILGLQDVRLWGVPSDSHFAQTLVEADYRMKLISVGLERSNVRGFRSHLALLSPRGNSIQRWWFTPLYDAFYRTEDGDAYQITGQRVQLVASDEVTDSAGKRSDAAFTRASTKKYAQQFTNHFPKMAESSSVFAELQNLFDLAIVAALIKKERLDVKVGWQMNLFLDPARATLVKAVVPRQVPSAFNYRTSRGRSLVGLIGGGVVVDPLETVSKIAFRPGKPQKLDDVRKGSLNREPPAKHPWWWD